MNLAAITAFIDAKIRNKTPKVIKIEHADVDQAIVNILFSEIKQENNASHTITTPNGSGITYDLKFKKVGNIVYLTGRIQNNTGSTLTNYDAINITNTEYLPKQSLIDSINRIPCLTKNLRACSIGFTSNAIKIIDILGTNDILLINGFYFTND